MAGTAITTTPQDITGDFDIQVIGNPTSPNPPPLQLQKALGAGGATFSTAKRLAGAQHLFVKNTGTNAFKIAADVEGLTVEFNQ